MSMYYSKLVECTRKICRKILGRVKWFIDRFQKHSNGVCISVGNSQIRGVVGGNIMKCMEKTFEARTHHLRKLQNTYKTTRRNYPFSTNFVTYTHVTAGHKETSYWIMTSGTINWSMKVDISLWTCFLLVSWTLIEADCSWRDWISWLMVDRWVRKPSNIPCMFCG